MIGLGTNKMLVGKSGGAGMNISDFSYTNKFFDISTKVSDFPYGLHITADGTKLFLTCSSNDRIYRAGMSTAWEINTASFSTYQEYDVTGEDPTSGISADPTGSRIYTTSSNSHKIYQYSTSNFDISFFGNMRLDSSYSMYSSWYPYGLTFNPDGYALYFAKYNSNGSHVIQLDMTQPWEVSTCVNNYKNVPISCTPRSMCMSGDGLYCFVGGMDNKIYQYNLATAWDMGTAEDSGNFLDVTPVVNGSGVVNGLFMKPDNSSIYVLDRGWDKIHQFSLAA